MCETVVPGVGMLFSACPSDGVRKRRGQPAGRRLVVAREQVGERIRERTCLRGIGLISRHRCVDVSRSSHAGIITLGCYRELNAS